MKYLRIKHYKGKKLLYWEPKKKYLIQGKWVKCPFHNTRCDDLTQVETLNKELDKWRKVGNATRQVKENTLSWLIVSYKKDKRYKNLANSTQALYEHLMPILEQDLGDIPLDKLSRKSARAFCVSFDDNPRKPSLIAAMGRMLYNFARDTVDDKLINPFDKLGISKPKARTQIWTADMIYAVHARATESNAASIALALQIGLDTGQRPGDLRLLAWNNYNGSTIKLRQSKTSVWVEIPVMKSLKAMLDDMPRTSLTILVDETTGKAYTRDRLCHRFREICDKAGIDKTIQFRDLRRSCVVRLAEHGCTNAEIAAITGHSINETAKILEVYLPRTKKMAENAIAKIEKVGRKQ